jgi:hypothetical protein
VRQARLYYLRGKVGRDARIRERRRLIRDEGESAAPAAQDAAPETEEEAGT